VTDTAPSRTGRRGMSVEGCGRRKRKFGKRVELNKGRGRCPMFGLPGALRLDRGLFRLVPGWGTLGCNASTGLVWGWGGICGFKSAAGNGKTVRGGCDRRRRRLVPGWETLEESCDRRRVELNKGSGRCPGRLVF
jgi:hypothetical protein